MTAVSTETPSNANRPEDGRNAERSVREFQRHQRAHRFGHDDSEGDGDRELEISIERKQDHENQHDREWANEIHLRFRFKKLAVFAAP